MLEAGSRWRSVWVVLATALGGAGVAALFVWALYGWWWSLWAGGLSLVAAATAVPVRMVRGRLEGWDTVRRAFTRMQLDKAGYEEVETGHTYDLNVVVGGRRYPCFHDSAMILRFKKGLPVTLRLNVFSDVMVVVLDYDRPADVAAGLPPAP